MAQLVHHRPANLAIRHVPPGWQQVGVQRVSWLWLLVRHVSCTADEVSDLDKEESLLSLAIRYGTREPTSAATRSSVQGAILWSTQPWFGRYVNFPSSRQRRRTGYKSTPRVNLAWTDSVDRTNVPVCRVLGRTGLRAQCPAVSWRHRTPRSSRVRIAAPPVVRGRCRPPGTWTDQLAERRTRRDE